MRGIDPPPRPARRLLARPDHDPRGGMLARRLSSRRSPMSGVTSAREWAMGREQNLELVKNLLDAVGHHDEKRYAEAYADNATARMAGVPSGLGGLIEGREAILENFHRQRPETFNLHLVFGDDDWVCASGKRSTDLATT